MSANLMLTMTFFFGNLQGDKCCLGVCAIYAW